MSLLRGLADDFPLQIWLNDHIWPAEARMTPGDMRAGVRLAILESIHSGSVFFSDMYFHWRDCLDAVGELGVRAAVADVFGIDSARIAPGKLADALVVDLSDPRLVPDSDFVSNWVYSAGNAPIRDVICDGRLIMENRRVPHEDEIIESARRTARDLLSRP